jgi:hypothetical protein
VIDGITKVSVVTATVAGRGVAAMEKLASTPDTKAGNRYAPF